MHDKLHSARGAVQHEYYAAVLDTMKRYICDGYPFDLATELGDDCTAVTFRFDPAVLAAYMAHLDVVEIAGGASLVG